ncbi:hypothetical protein AMAG_02081 [Allomyces macrogynus ATCC 38327]|uniref:BZIP domain-containing protein n=1 Tax=Allomyces macrogynus (strain ATCC 38327) TaxID=578462 RepID=A0A0L0S0X2_ALLM3|nr:hypothetical protein AMAG_02081 [Allomyces macrogynus ATCC 38327]|eukprot:KNE56247.1 hypothetical protein AMAG_02081 [Allomyces macrogynus ATCC 38327]
MSAPCCRPHRILSLARLAPSPSTVSIPRPPPPPLPPANMDVDDLIQSLFAPPGAPASPPVSPVRNDVFLPSSPAGSSASSTASSSGTDRLLAFVDAQANAATADSAMDWAADLPRPDALAMDLDLDLDLDAYLHFPAAPRRAASPAPVSVDARPAVKSPSLTCGRDAQTVGPISAAPVPAAAAAAAKSAAPPVTAPVAKAGAPSVAPAALAAAPADATTAAETAAIPVVPAAVQVATQAAATVTAKTQPETDATRSSPAPKSQFQAPTTPTTISTPTPTLPAFSATNAAAVPPVPPLPLYSPYWMTPAAAASPYAAGPYAAAAVAAAAAAAAGGMYAPPPASFPYASLYGMLPPPPPTPTGMLGPAAWRAAAPDIPLDGLVGKPSSSTSKRAPKRRHAAAADDPAQPAAGARRKLDVDDTPAAHAQPAASPAPTSSSSSASDDDSTGTKPRDAAALLTTPPDQLSPDDKKALRKIKNRLAASESRKRAREHVELLEMEVAKLKDEKSALQAQVQQVLDDHARLVQDHDRVLAQLRLLRDAHAYFQVATGTNGPTAPVVPFMMATPQSSSLVHVTGPAIKSFGALFAIVVLGAAWLLPALSALAPNASTTGSAPLSLTASPAAFRSALELVAAAAAPNAGSSSTGTGKAGSAMPYMATTAGGVKVMVLDAPRRSDVVAVNAADNTADPMDLDDDVPSLPAPDARVLYLGDGKDGEHRDQAVVVTVVHSEEGAGGALPALNIKLSDDGNNGASLQIKVEPASDADAAMCRATAASLLTAAAGAEAAPRPPRPAAADAVRPKQEEGGAMPPHSFLIHVEPPSPTAARAESTGPGDALPVPPGTVPSPHAPLRGKTARLAVDEGGVRAPAPPTDSGRVFVRGPGSKLA